MISVTQNCCQSTMIRPHNLLHNFALGVSASGMASSNQEKPVMHAHTQTKQGTHIQYTHTCST